MFIFNLPFKFYLVTLSCFIILLLRKTEGTKENENFNGINTGLIKGEDDRLLVLSTLDGSLIGINHKTGEVRWKLQNEPAVKVPVNSKNAIAPIFLPDPKDGSLYLLNNAESRVLKKLPFSIQQLVASSPCRSNDGIFYSGKKVDSWFSVDWKTGKRTSVLSFDKNEKTCPVSSTDALFIGRTEYSIMMHDGMRHNRQWNVTFYDYASSRISADEANNYGYIHIGGSGSGRVRTLERGSGSIIWEADYGSPLVALYIRSGQDMLAIPFTSLADSALDSFSFHQQKENLLPTLYIGEHQHGLYALPSLAGRDLQVLHLNTPPRLLIEGPYSTNENDVIILGHYGMPDVSKTQLQIAGRSDPVIFSNKTSFNGTRRQSLKPSQAPVRKSDATNVENRLLTFVVAGLVVTVFAMFLYFRAQVRDIQLSSRGSSQGSNSGGVAVEIQQGTIVIGKISFNTQHILGKGCEGTFVFKGEFDGRSVAVKRLLPDCFTVADREVTLLRESDAHPHVVRYFCMEQDVQFRYIALELCSATLQDYVEKGVHKDDITPIETLKQASSGLGHLHSLNIVHRDIKPHNILLSSSSGVPSLVRAMISDFGLCKKLQNGRASFSRRSGITGTDGWIAPEMILSTGRTMCAVDVFSLGCVFYYVISNGKHPFGEPLRRQANILSYDYRLTAIEEDMLWRVLIEKMISQDPHERPSISVVIQYPVFWEKVFILSFLQDVSDRVEKENFESGVLISLERADICKGDWREVVDPEVAADLRKYRTYRGDSVRDLLRALRNKKHHYRELSYEAQALLGENSESFTDYWLSHFPSLLYHTWSSMQILRKEPGFAQYYHPCGYLFPCSKAPPPSWISDTKARTPKKVPLPQPPESTDSEMETWIRSGRDSGAWRPKTHRGRLRKKEKREMENIVWKLPAT